MNESIEILMKYQTEVNRLNTVQLEHEKKIAQLNATVLAMNDVVTKLVAAVDQGHQFNMDLLDVLGGRTPSK